MIFIYIYIILGVHLYGEYALINLFYRSKSMKELTNSCCLHHVSGGWGWSGDPNCPGCNGEWDEQDKMGKMQSASLISRDGFSGYIGDIGGILTALGAGYSGVGVLTGTAISFGATKGFTMLGEYIYDNPEAARHPDYPDYSDYKYP